ncbi:cysteine-rich repeat secretory protein 38-like [Quercus robur]|uniref:cysteine-rich repeat secretory protein 38-like n=1 Tax=Quercus robur TaxID=38942 RepID=UPI00216258C9|nr:cysteine-rich repeat secretory protein 38-like [Quercus robur]
MFSSHFTFSICLLTFAFFLQTTFGASPIFHICSSSAGNFASNSSYELNLNNLLGNLYNQTPPQGFGLISVGISPNQAYGLSLCRGDLSATDCQTCVNEASSEIPLLCPYNKGAIIWYDNCLLKYLNTDFFHQIDNQNQFSMWNPQNASNSTTFTNQTSEFLTLLAVEATLTPELYAVGELDVAVGGSNKLYGLVQ